MLLENGSSFNGKAVIFNSPNMPRCRIFFKDNNRHDLRVDTDIMINKGNVSALKLFLNNYLIALHQEALLEFPDWLEHYSNRAKESNPFFNLDEIRAEFQHKKSRFGHWRAAAHVGFFDDIRSQHAKFHKIVHLEISELPSPF